MKHAELYKRIWYDDNFNSPARQAYTLAVLLMSSREMVSGLTMGAVKG